MKKIKKNCQKFWYREIISIFPELNLEFDLIAVIVQFFKAGKLFFRYDDVIMASVPVVQVS